jgi:trehalose utilization protein
MINVTIWNEFIQEKRDEPVKNIYPEGIHETIANYLRQYDNFMVRTATLEQPSHGLTDEVLNSTDVLIWWGHVAHHEVSDDIVQKVRNRVLSGMGLIVLHSAHDSKIFKSLMGTACTLKYREIGERERVWIVNPSHPIVKGIDEHFVIENEEMYGEPFDIPTPDELILIGWFQGGEVFRSGCCYRRGYGNIFYFQPGHETYPVYKNESVMKIIKNAVEWAKTDSHRGTIQCNNVKQLENWS